MIAPDLAKDLEELRIRGYTVDQIIEEGSETIVVFGAFGLPDGKYNMPSCRVLVRVPNGYPNAALDMFYSQPDLLLASGATAKQSDVLEQLGGNVWRRFSWHRNVPWKPGVDSLVSFVSFVEDRLARAQ